MLYNFLINSAIVIFSFYIICCIAKLAIKTFFFISSLRNLESAVIDLISNHLPRLFQSRSNHDLSLLDSNCNDCSDFPCCQDCTCSSQQKNLDTPKISVVDSDKLS